MKEKQRSDFLCLKKQYEERDAVSKIREYIDSNRCYRKEILFVMGLKGMGTIILIEQALLHYPAEKCVYYELQDGDTVYDVEMELFDAHDNGKEIVVIDGITKAKDFIDECTYLNDVFATWGMRIIATGSDSLSILFAIKEIMEESDYHIYKAVVSNRYISFAEYYKLWGTRDANGYATYGGIMQYPGGEAVLSGEDNGLVVYDIQSARDYVDNAIAMNILNSLKLNRMNIGRENQLKRLSEMEMKRLTQNTIEKFVGVPDIDVIEEEIEAGTYRLKQGIVCKMGIIRKQWIIPIPILSMKEAMSNPESPSRSTYCIERELAEKFNTEEKPDIFITEQTIFYLIEYLEILGVSMETMTVTFKKNGDCWDETGKIHYEMGIRQSAIRYQYLWDALKCVEENNCYLKLSIQEREQVKIYLENRIKEEMIMQTVLDEMRKLLKHKKYRVCKLKFESGEGTNWQYDMLIWDAQANKHWKFYIMNCQDIFEIPDMGNNFKEQYPDAEEITEMINLKYGHCEMTGVLYNGESFVVDGNLNKAAYFNIADFLVAAEKYKEIDNAMDKIMEELIANIPIHKN